MSGSLDKSVQRIVEANQKARAQSHERASRLMDALVEGDRSKFSEAVNDIIDAATGSRKEGDDILGEDGKPKPPDGSTDGTGSQT